MMKTKMKTPDVWLWLWLVTRNHQAQNLGIVEKGCGDWQLFFLLSIHFARERPRNMGA
jgi:hypothetical protein